MNQQTISNKYLEYLINLPAPGYGNGLHQRLLGAANIGLHAGRHPEQIKCDLRLAIKPGRTVPDREIDAAIARAVADFSSSSHRRRSRRQSQPISISRPNPMVRDGETVFRNIVDQATIRNDADLWEASPVKIDWSPAEDSCHFLAAMFDEDDLVFIGGGKESGQLGRNIRTAAEWKQYFQKGFKTGPHVLINPLNGRLEPKKSGNGLTYRGDNNVEVFRYCLGEFDVRSHEEQVKFWSVIDLPVRALVDTGGKSIHAWIDIQKMGEIRNQDDWQRITKHFLYGQILKPMDADPNCSNPSRLSRLPGHFRSETKKMQRLLWLSHEGRKVVV